MPAGIDLGQILQVEPTVQRGHGSRRKIFEQGKMNEIDMEMQKVKCVPAQMKLVQHGQVSGKVRLQQRRIKPDGLIAHGNQRRAGIGVRAREQRDLMPQLHKSVAQVRNDAFRAAINFGGTAS